MHNGLFVNLVAEENSFYLKAVMALIQNYIVKSPFKKNLYVNPST